jgi:hypothetical protein
MTPNNFRENEFYLASRGRYALRARDIQGARGYHRTGVNAACSVRKPALSGLGRGARRVHPRADFVWQDADDIR